MYETEPTIIEIDEEKYFVLPQPKEDQIFYRVIASTKKIIFFIF